MKFAIAALLAIACSTAAQAEPTRLMVRAHSADAKFISQSMGGVKITLTDTASGKVLAEGVTAGETGDTKVIMQTPHVRNARLTNDKTAGFETTLDLDKPTLVTVTAHGPLGKPAAAITVTSSLWMLPGRDVLGDGWVLDFPGLVVEPAASPAAGGGLRVSAKVTLMCGCPIEPGGVWAAEHYAVEASLLSPRGVVAKAPLAYAGAASQFATTLTAPAGAYRLRVTAADSTTPNAGVTEIDVTVP